MTEVDIFIIGILQISGLPPASELLVLGTALVLTGVLFLFQAQLISFPAFSPQAALIITAIVALALGYYIQQTGIPEWYPPLIGAGLAFLAPFAICLKLIRELSVV